MINEIMLEMKDINILAIKLLPVAFLFALIIVPICDYETRESEERKQKERICELRCKYCKRRNKK